MTSFSSREILSMLRKNGWVVERQHGSHIQLVHPTLPGRVTVPHPKQDLGKETLATILKQAGLDKLSLSRQRGK